MNILQRAIVVFGSLFLALTIGQAYGQETYICRPFADYEQFKAVNKAHTIVHGIDGDGDMIEFIVNPAGRFAVTMVNPDGTACLMTAGDNYLFYGDIDVGRSENNESGS